MVLQADGSFKPRQLPKNRYVPIDFQGHADIRETDGSVPPPLQHVRIDFDRDGLSNIDEFRAGTQIRNRDSDGDGIADGEEVRAGSDGWVTNCQSVFVQEECDSSVS